MSVQKKSKSSSKVSKKNAKKVTKKVAKKTAKKVTKKAVSKKPLKSKASKKPDVKKVLKKSGKIIAKANKKSESKIVVEAPAVATQKEAGAGVDNTSCMTDKQGRDALKSARDDFKSYFSELIYDAMQGCIGEDAIEVDAISAVKEAVNRFIEERMARLTNRVEHNSFLLTETALLKK